MSTEVGIARLAFAPDTLTNNEFGWKTMWMDRRVQWDGAIYQENWDHAQISLNGARYRRSGPFHQRW